ncbi:MAG: response regulator [Verrucomicrobia bacterium]|nr:response regulator [Verrucomicrobiota bacterium]
MSKTIITVDDAATMRKMISFTLKGAGHEVLEAADGVEALKTLQTRAVDMVITDVNMPNMDGLTLTRSLRALPQFARTPIVLLTTESAPEKKAEGKAAGATGWIVKPFQQDQLLAVVAKVLGP